VVPTTSRPAPEIGVLIVAYNAASSLESVLNRIPPDFRGRVSRVLLMDDHSRDSTFLVGLGYQQLETALPLEVTRHPQNLGYGGNQKAGYRRAIELGLDIIVLLHGDGQYAPELLAEMVAPLERGECDAVFGSRMMVKGSARKGGMPLYKYVGNRILTRFENAMLGTDLSEFHSGYRAYSVDALKRINVERFSDGFDFDTEIIIALVDAGMTIREIPIPTYYGDEICYVDGVKYARDITVDVLSYRASRLGLGRSEMWTVPDETTAANDVFGHSHRQILAWMNRPPARVLELGCGTGQLSERLREMGHYVVGVDLPAHPDAKERTNELIEADLDHGLPPGIGDDFDVIICGDVFERVRNPHELMADLAKVATPRARMLVTVSNFGHWYPRLRAVTGRFGYDQRGILDDGHIRFFTRRSFHRLSSRNNWRSIRSATTSVPYELLAPGRLASVGHFFERAARSVWPTMFAYQFVYDLERTPAPTS
jgi:glycosyltransferase involved in cell wall biosynthesis